jgi:hypothetical protein
MVTPLSHVFFRAFFSLFFGLFTFYFLTWAILASTVPDVEALLRFGGCTILSGIGSIYFIIVYQKSDVYLPRTQSILFYSTMAVVSVLMGIYLFFHIESYQAIPFRMRIPTQVLAVLVYMVFFGFSLIRASESRFLPSLSKSRVSDELVK